MVLGAFEAATDPFGAKPAMEFQLARKDDSFDGVRKWYRGNTLDLAYKELAGELPLPESSFENAALMVANPWISAGWAKARGPRDAVRFFPVPGSGNVSGLLIPSQGPATGGDVYGKILALLAPLPGASGAPEEFVARLAVENRIASYYTGRFGAIGDHIIQDSRDRKSTVRKAAGALSGELAFLHKEAALWWAMALEHGEGEMDGSTLLSRGTVRLAMLLESAALGDNEEGIQLFLKWLVINNLLHIGKNGSLSMNLSPHLATLTSALLVRLLSLRLAGDIQANRAFIKELEPTENGHKNIWRLLEEVAAIVDGTVETHEKATRATVWTHVVTGISAATP